MTGKTKDESAASGAAEGTALLLYFTTGKTKEPTRTTLTFWGWLKILFGFAVGTAVGGYSFYIAYMQPSQFSALIWLLGGLAGWIAGIILSPTTGAERDLFREWGSVIATFLSGFALARLDKLWATVVPESGAISSEVLMNVLLFLVAFGVGLLFTFIGRTSEFPVVEQKSAVASAPTEAKPAAGGVATTEAG